MSDTNNKGNNTPKGNNRMPKQQKSNGGKNQGGKKKDRDWFMYVFYVVFIISIGK